MVVRRVAGAMNNPELGECVLRNVQESRAIVKVPAPVRVALMKRVSYLAVSSASSGATHAFIAKGESLPEVVHIRSKLH